MLMIAAIMKVYMLQRCWLISAFGLQLCLSLIFLFPKS